MTLSIVDFLNARLDEDEATAQRVQPNQSPTELRAMVGREGGEPFLIVASERVLREVAAKRAMLNMHYEVAVDLPWCAECETVRGFPCRTLKHLAAVYSDHPDYQDGWKPISETPDAEPTA
jgi:hypothetical protein